MSELHGLLVREVMVRRLKRDVLGELPPLRRQVVRLPCPHNFRCVRFCVCVHVCVCVCSPAVCMCVCDWVGGVGGCLLCMFVCFACQNSGARTWVCVGGGEGGPICCFCACVCHTCKTLDVCMCVYVPLLVWADIC